MKFSDYFYASIPSVCLLLPLAQWIPNLEFLQGLEKLGIVGIMGLGIVFFVMERRNFIARSGTRLETLENRISALENKVTTGNDKMINLLGQQLAELREIKLGQSENFSRMWDITLRSLNGTINHEDEFRNRFSLDEEDVLRPGENQAESRRPDPQGLVEIRGLRAAGGETVDP